MVVEEAAAIAPAMSIATSTALVCATPIVVIVIAVTMAAVGPAVTAPRESDATTVGSAPNPELGFFPQILRNRSWTRDQSINVQV